MRKENNLEWQRPNRTKPRSRLKIGALFGAVHYHGKTPCLHCAMQNHTPHPLSSEINLLRSAIQQLERETGDAEISPEGEALKAMLSILVARLEDEAMTRPTGYDDELWRSAMLARACGFLAANNVPTVSDIVIPATQTIEDAIIEAR